MASTVPDTAHDANIVANSVEAITHNTLRAMNTPCKGKTAKSWLDLPAEIVRHVVFHIPRHRLAYPLV